MNKSYIRLFKELAKTMQVLAEKAMDEDKKNEDNESFNNAITMRKNYMDLHDIFAHLEKDEAVELTRADFSKLIVAAYLAVSQLEAHRNALDSSINGYKIDIIPKLNRIMNETHTDEEALVLAEELFQIKE